ncbi:lipopolysaccharide transport periplasmic protein LptA [Legionella sp. W05-934-2]|jgi:lipopolysaccharide export system protein LptA|uniref:lipopolysaccharide transport periplasmic protein LptA n=1 Tax=Legionella sp. W05-934-2 TaxID=1198649 RepID=UPI00346376D9
MQTRKFIIPVPITMLLLLLGLGVVSYALPDDKYKPIQLSADSADLNQSTHKGEYNGHVDFRQGTSHITANRAITIVDEHNKLKEAIAYGTNETRAHFSTNTDTKKPRLHAKADIIRYFPLKHLIELEGHAVVTQGHDRFEAHIIRYDTLNQHVVSNSNGERRTLIVINSDKIK